jgi:hypothetical protein
MRQTEFERPLQAEALREIERSVYGKLRAHRLSDSFIARYGEEAVQKGLVEYLRARERGVEIDNRDAFVVQAAFRRAIDELRRETRQLDGTAVEAILESGRVSSPPSEELAVEEVRRRGGAPSGSRAARGRAPGAVFALLRGAERPKRRGTPVLQRTHLPPTLEEGAWPSRPPARRPRPGAGLRSRNRGRPCGLGESARRHGRPCPRSTRPGGGPRRICPGSCELGRRSGSRSRRPGPGQRRRRKGGGDRDRAGGQGGRRMYRSARPLPPGRRRGSRRGRAQPDPRSRASATSERRARCRRPSRAVHLGISVAGVELGGDDAARLVDGLKAAIDILSS